MLVLVASWYALIKRIGCILVLYALIKWLLSGLRGAFYGFVMIRMIILVSELVILKTRSMIEIDSEGQNKSKLDSLSERFWGGPRNCQGRLGETCWCHWGLVWAKFVDSGASLMPFRALLGQIGGQIGPWRFWGGPRNCQGRLGETFWCHWGLVWAKWIFMAGIFLFIFPPVSGQGGQG